MDLGVNLFGVLSHSPLPEAETLQRLRDIGYTHIEPCLALDPIPGMERVFWSVSHFSVLLPVIRQIGLQVPSAHLLGGNLNARSEALCRLAREAGIRAYVVKTPQEADDCALQQAAMTYLTLADTLAEAGVKLLLHNEAADIRARSHGKTVCERLADLCQGRVGLQADVGWAMAGGEDPVSFLYRNRNAVFSLHYKDFDAAGNPVKIGTGCLPLAACFRFARGRGIPQLVDQDTFDGELFAELADIRQRIAGLTADRAGSVSYLNVMDTQTGEARVLARFDRVIEAPNWHPQTGELIYNADGLLYAWKDGRERLIPTGACNQCNNDHVLSPAGDAVAVSHMTFEEGFSSRVYIVPFATGEPRLVTPNSPSFLHGWSPDGEELAYCAFREHGGKREVDIYTIPAAGGEEKRLTFGGFNDGPEYSPDGRHIWFNSTRSGLMQVWRMNRDGSEPMQMTRGEENFWFGHVSPDGQKVACIAYRKGHLDPAEHLPDMQVSLWLMNRDGTNLRRILSFFGGQGSINVNSWAPDSRHFAFVSYEPAEGAC